MLIDDLSDLEDILETIQGDDNNMNKLTQNEQQDIIDTCQSLMFDYVNQHPTAVSEPDFSDDMINEVKELINVQLNMCQSIDIDEDDLDDIIDIGEELFYSTIMPKRSYNTTFDINNKDKHNEIQDAISYLDSIPQHEQRTKEWYKTRYNLITASNAYKAFESQSVQNQLIYEKCIPLFINENNENNEGSGINEKSSPVNVNTTLHWGQKYEPISVMYYEHTYNTNVCDYGCIPHNKYTFLGASPDGIVTDPKSNRYGRMLEIKNIVNREINGIPKKEYWIQMQLQMETCNLDECDFLETKFIEYENETEYFSDGNFTHSMNGDMKGIILYYSTDSGRPIYIYKPLNMEQKDYISWETQHMIDQEKNGNTWIKNIYWKLEEISCVLVLRNKKWFNDNVYQLQNIWNIIVKERISGFEHRKPNKRIKKTDLSNNLDLNECMINIDKETGKVSLNNNNEKRSRSNSTISVSEIRIRTESIDESNKSILDNIAYP